MKHGCYKIGVLVAILSVGQSARAEPESPAQSTPAKEALEWAHRGKERFEKGDHVGAIAALGEAERLHHSPAFAHFLALAHEKAGNLVEARRLHQTVVDTKLSPTAPTEWEAAQRESARAVQSLDARIPTLEIVLSSANGSALVVTFDGARVDAATLGRPAPSNPGTHTLVVEVPGGERITRTLVLKESARERVHVALPPDRRGARGPVPPGSPADGEARSSGHPDALRKGAYVSYGVGAGALVAGSVAGGLALAKTSDAREACGTDFEANRCRADRGGPLQEARTAADVSTAGFVLAGVGAALGTVLLVWPRSAEPLRVGVGAGLLTIEGGF